MAPAHSKLGDGKPKKILTLRDVIEPAIPFKRPKKDKKKDESWEEKEKMRSFKIKVDPLGEDEEDELEAKIRAFDTGGTPEDWVEFLQKMDDLFEKRQIHRDGDGLKRHQVYQHCLTGQAYNDYLAYFNSRREANNARPEGQKHSMDTAVAHVINDMSVEYFAQFNGEGAAKGQKSYLRSSLKMENMEPSMWYKRFEEINL